ncbi:MAG: AtpZ/AtpI family protein [Acidobacteriota bacterium]|nr:MAG: AtpZ/AtpI family protein [Acidobacteriota bacterium]
MIKSILEDEDQPEDGREEKRGLLRKRRQKDDLVSIGLSSNEPNEGDLPGESVEEIRNGILGVSSPGPEVRTESEGGQETEKPAEAVEISESGPESGGRAAELEKMLKELEKELEREKTLERRSANRDSGEDHTLPEAIGATQLPGSGTYHSDSESGPFSVPDDDPVSQVEIFRRMGLAWSAAIALFGSVVFMLAIGWVADVLFGSSPWGIVTGIVLGAAIGFFQLFRITSHIMGNGTNDFDKVSLRASFEPDPPAPEPKSSPESGDSLDSI